MNVLYRVERHLRRNGITASAFGRRVMNDPGFVRQLRNGREPTAKTEARILAAIEAAERRGGKRRKGGACNA